MRSAAPHTRLQVCHTERLSMQVAKNGHAMLAARALGQLAGGLPGTLATPACEEAQQQLQSLLTPPLAAMLGSPDPTRLLQHLNSNIQSPEVGLQHVCSASELSRTDFTLRMLSCSISCCWPCLSSGPCSTPAFDSIGCTSSLWNP